MRKQTRSGGSNYPSTAGMPMRPGYPESEEIFQGPPEEDLAFNQYVSEFPTMTERMEKIRVQWLAKVPMDDPLKADEPQFCVTEKIIFEDLLARNASSRQLIKAHT
eukprot:1268953-Karenia_brevis.AAC.1